MPTDELLNVSKESCMDHTERNVPIVFEANNEELMAINMGSWLEADDWGD